MMLPIIVKTTLRQNKTTGILLGCGPPFGQVPTGVSCTGTSETCSSSFDSSIVALNVSNLDNSSGFGCGFQPSHPTRSKESVNLVRLKPNATNFTNSTNVDLAILSCGCQEDLKEQRNYVLAFLTLEARFIHAVHAV